MSSIRLKREIERLVSHPPDGITCYPKNESLKVLEASIRGVPGSPYENGVFLLDINIPDKYPFDVPSLKFSTKIYHPNIDDGGRICLDLLKPMPKGTWKPTVTIEGLLVAVQFLLGQPNPNDPLMHDIAKEFQYNNMEYIRKAKAWTLKYATAHQPSNAEESSNFKRKSNELISFDENIPPNKKIKTLNDASSC